jgi:hypothetical protein
MWLGYVLGGLITPLITPGGYEPPLAVEVLREVTRNHAVAYSKVCRLGFVIVLLFSICSLAIEKVKGKRNA